MCCDSLPCAQNDDPSGHQALRLSATRPRCELSSARRPLPDNSHGLATVDAFHARGFRVAPEPAPSMNGAPASSMSSVQSRRRHDVGAFVERPGSGIDELAP